MDAAPAEREGGVKSKPHQTGTIYFMRRVDGVGPIKIGCSSCPKGRLAVYDEWSPEKLMLIATAPGTFADEARLHRQFASARLHHEWFEATPELLSVVAKVASTGNLPPASSNDKWQRIEAMYRGGKTLQAIGDELGVTRERVRQILRKAGVPSYGHRFGVGKVQSGALRQKDKVIALAKQGLPAIDIARQIRSDRISVLKVLRHCGVEVSPAKRGRPSKPGTLARAKAVSADYAAGLKIRDIAAKHEIDLAEIYRLLRYAGQQPTRAPKRRAA